MLDLPLPPPATTAMIAVIGFAMLTVIGLAHRVTRLRRGITEAQGYLDRIDRHAYQSDGCLCEGCTLALFGALDCLDQAMKETA